MSEEEYKVKIEELEKENQKLKDKIKELKSIMNNRITTGSMTPCQTIQSLISNKVYSEVKETFGRVTKQSLKRKIMEDLKWELHIRYANDFKEEHIELAKMFIENYQIEEFYK